MPVHSGTSRAVSASGRKVSPCVDRAVDRDELERGVVGVGRRGSSTAGRSSPRRPGRSRNPASPRRRPRRRTRRASSRSVCACGGEVALNGPLRSSSTQREHPAGEVADVDHLHRLVGRREDRAAALDPARPVGEAVGRVVRADDQAGADEDRAVAERRARPLARRAPSARRSSRSPRAAGRRGGSPGAARAGSFSTRGSR